jgi:hypothetical protein
MVDGRRVVLLGFALLMASCARGGGGGGGDGRGGSWSAPTYFPPPDGAPLAVSEVRVGVDSTGAGMLFWSTYSGAGTQYQYSRYAPGSGWSVPIAFSPGVPVGSMPELGMQADGEAVLAWYGVSGGTGHIYVARARKGSDFGTPAAIASADSPTGLRLHVRATGHAIVGWTQNDAGGVLRAWASVYAPGGAWSSAAAVDATVYGVDSASLRVAADALGGAFTAWSEQDQGAAGVWAARYALGSGWGTPIVLDTSSGSAAQPDISASSDGHAVATWMQPDATAMVQQVFTSRFDPAAGWSTAELLMSSANATGYSFPYPRVAMNDGREALAVWRELDRTSLEFTALGSHATAAGAWATPFQLDGPLGASSTSQDSWLTPALAGTGDGIAIWCGMDQIRTRTYHAGGSWGDRTQLSSGTYASAEPRMAMNASGQTIVAWTEVVGMAVDRVAVVTFSGF